MVLEVAILSVRTGGGAEFEAAFERATPLVRASPGYLGHTLMRCLEAEDRYLLQIWWDRLESHTEGFRGSPGYQEWKALLHHFYEPFPVVEHYETSQEGSAP
jgi:heme-degrading monooxygenase HmoA